MPELALSEISPVMGMPLPFTNGEYRRRIDAVRKRMAAEKLDALLLYHQESMFYLFGYDQIGYYIYATAIVTADSPDVVVLCRSFDHGMIAGLPHVKDVRHWHDDSTLGPVGETVEMLRDLQLLKRGKRIGIELSTHALLPHYYKQLDEALREDCRLVEASDLVTEQRLLKSDAEVVYMREAGKVMDAAYAAAFEALRPGVLETEVLGSALMGMFRAGGHFPAIVPPFASGPRTMSKTHGSAVDRRILPNEPVTIEPASSRHRYHAIGVQTRWTGEPPRDVQKSFDGILQAHAMAKTSIRPGVPAAALAREIDRALEELDISRPGGHHGYGTGIGYPPTWVDTLRIKETDTHVLEKNMTFFLMGHWSVRREAGPPVELFVGEPILVTADGHESLSTTPLSLV